MPPTQGDILAAECGDSHLAATQGEDCARPVPLFSRQRWQQRQQGGRVGTGAATRRQGTTCLSPQLQPHKHTASLESIHTQRGAYTSTLQCSREAHSSDTRQCAMARDMSFPLLSTPTQDAHKPAGDHAAAPKHPARRNSPAVTCQPRSTRSSKRCGPATCGPRCALASWVRCLLHERHTRPGSAADAAACTACNK